MSKKIIAFGASISKSSINKQFATYVANQLSEVEVEVLDLNDYQLPFYSAQLEKENGIPENAIHFDEQLKSADGFVISLAEYNGSYTGVFKNLFDWLSRIDMKTVWKNKPMLLLSTSPGKRGGATVMGIAKDSWFRFGAEIITNFSLPSFYDNFHEDGIKDETLSSDLIAKIAKFQESI